MAKVRVSRVAGAVLATITLSGLGLASSSSALTGSPTPREVTTTHGGQSQNSAIDSRGDLIVFTSNATDNGASTFDDSNLGNGFTPPAASHPNPSCVNCNNADGNGEIFIWRSRAGGAKPANSFQQITDTTGGNFAANSFPDINQKGTFVAWDSDRDPLGSNADGNREIFLYDIAHGLMTQITQTTGGADNANRNVSLSDDGTKIAFDSNRDYAGIDSCTMADGTTPCNNADGNNEVMIFDVKHTKMTQVTDTTGGNASANARVQISGEGQFLSFQTTRDYSATNCTMFDATTPCSNGDGNGEIMEFSLATNHFTQITATTGCGGATANERATISKKGAFVVWQSTCESQLNTPGCGSCDNHDEVFVFDSHNHRILQATISASGTNRVPRISESGAYIVFETSNRNFNGLNPGHDRILYVLKRNTTLGKNSTTGPGQLVDDTGSPLVQNSHAKVFTINFAGGFNTTVEQFGVSSAGKYISFDNGHGGLGRANQEIWFIDRTK